MVDKKTTADLVSERPTSEELVNLPRIPIKLVVDNVRSLDNVGLLFRLCETARIEKLYLTGYTGHPKQDEDPRPQWMIDRHEHRIMKTAVYALEHQPWEYIQDPRELITQWKQSGHQIVALEQTKQSISYTKANYSLPLVFIVGHERQGVRQELLELADTIVEIPILGLGNSHNVSISTGIVLYHILEKTGQIQ